MHPTFDAFGLTLFIKSHDDDSRSIPANLASLFQEFFFAFLEADRVNNGLALYALQTGLDDVPARRVNHDRHARDIRLGSNQAEKSLHRRRGVEHAFVHVDIDDLCTVIDLLAGHRDCRWIVLFADQSAKFCRTGHVGAFANVHKQRIGTDCHWLETAQSEHDRNTGGLTRAVPFHSLPDDANVLWRRATTTANHVQHPGGSKITENLSHGFRRIVIATEFIRQPGIRVHADAGSCNPAQFGNIGAQILSPERTIKPDDKRVSVAD